MTQIGISNFYASYHQFFVKRFGEILTLYYCFSSHLSISPATFYILLVFLPIFLRTSGLMIGVPAFLARRLGRSVKVACGNRELKGLKREASCWARGRH